MIQDMQDLSLSESRPQQTTEALRRAEALLQSQGLDYPSVARTWIYLDKILEWYTPFNEARSAFYRRVGIMPDIEKSEVTPARECYLPASTGIRGRNLSGAACTIDLIAAEIPGDSGFTVRRLTNRKQKDIVTAMQITDEFREIWPEDPVMGDFALFGYGVTR
ncbi:MAG: DUF2400 family protein [Verrucomicrobia bacterium]|nr:DUF2400 family protein [Verrucomicrobiota bacterium]